MLTILNIIGWIRSHLRFIGVCIAIVLTIVLGLWAKSCWNSHKAKMSEKAIAEAKQAIAEQNDEHLKTVLAKADADQAAIDGTVANSEAETKKVEAESKAKLDSLSHDELQAEAIRRVQEAQQ